MPVSLKKIIFETTLIYKNLKTALFACLLCTFFAQAPAQKFSYGLNAGYTQIKYSFPVEKNRYHTSSIQPLSAVKGGATVHYSISNSLRLVTGLEYVSVKGSADGGDMPQSMANPNSEGRMQFDVDNSHFIIPIGFQLHFGSGNVRPFASAAMNVFKILDQNINITVEPEEYDPSYEKVGTTIDKTTESSYFGARLSGGISFSAIKHHEFSLLLSRHFNVSRYELGDPIKGIFEKHEIRFNMWELALAWNLNFHAP